PLEGEGSGERGKKALKLMHMGRVSNPPLRIAPSVGARSKCDEELEAGIHEFSTEWEKELDELF
ncbi:MAG: hypothetical protein JXB47_13295, partial [Anaerolineae bacterium]|nr:hypothetical protein [Anaerolineae bacterium]